MTSAVLENFVCALKRDALGYADYVAASNELQVLTPNQTGRPPLKIAILRNFTFEPLLPVIAGEVFLAGFHPLFYLGDFNAVQEDALNPQSPLYAFEPDFIILAQWLETLSPALTSRFVGKSSKQIEAESERVREHLRDIISGLNANSRATILLNNFPLPSDPTLGILDAQSTGFHTHSVMTLNREILRDTSNMSDVFVVDILRLFAKFGSANCIDERHWQMARAPLSQKALVPIGKEYAKYIRALRGKTKKCLVLDCDNTLWGGIVGEDGIEGIALGSTYPGSCFAAMQQEILNLHDRGVILALCSKNNEADVLQVLREHPDMLLREEHLATWQINWDDKVTNLKRIAADLNIGLDSLVFVDDSEFEVNLVREQLPDVAIIHLPPKSYSLYRSRIAEGAYFDSLTLTDEDKRKNAMYADERKRKSVQSSATSLIDYLTKLEIVAEIGPPDEIDVPRVSQLTQKTNQFNLTTRRYSESAIRELVESDQADVLCIKVRDKISDLGLVGIAIVRYSDHIADVDSFLLSCRAIGRGVEDALLAAVVERAFAVRGCRRITGTYIPSAKNAIVKGFWERNGFLSLAGTHDHQVWEYCADGHPMALASPAWIRVIEGERSYASR